MTWTKRILSFSGIVLFAASSLLSQNVGSDFKGMRFSPKEMKDHIAHFNALPRTSFNKIQTQNITTPSYLNLLSYFPHDATLWNQGSNCGNCWVWGSTAVVSIMNGIRGFPGPLSVQYFDSAYNSGSGSGFACCGGFPEFFVDYYNNHVGFFVPWSNGNASYADAPAACGGSTYQPVSGIATNPNYPFVSISLNAVDTHTWFETRQQAISAIKSTLNMNIPIAFTFFVSNSEYTALKSWWWSADENSVFSSFDLMPGGSDVGHTVALVGYDDSDSSWILLNSWGTTNGRPNGTFKIPQNIGYAPPDNHLRLEFNFFNIAWYNTNVTIPIPSSDQTISSGTNISFTGNCSNGAGQPLRYSWDFGDGSSTSGSSASVAHTFTTSNGSVQTRTVVLTVFSMSNPMSPTVMGKGSRIITVCP